MKSYFTISPLLTKNLFHTEIIFQSGIKSSVLVHHTVFFTTNKSRSVSFPRWVFLLISRKLYVCTRNPGGSYQPSDVGLFDRDIWSFCSWDQPATNEKLEVRNRRWKFTTPKIQISGNINRKQPNCHNKGPGFHSRWLMEHPLGWQVLCWSTQIALSQHIICKLWGRVACRRTQWHVWPQLWHPPSRRSWLQLWEVALRSWLRCGGTSRLEKWEIHTTQDMLEWFAALRQDRIGQEQQDEIRAWKISEKYYREAWKPGQMVLHPDSWPR